MKKKKSTASKSRPTIAVYGLGFVGLTMGLTLAEAGFPIIGIEPRKRSLDKLRQGIPPIHEKGLAPLLRRHLNKNFRIVNGPKGVKASVHVVAVGTPILEPEKKPSMKYIESVAKSIGSIIHRGHLVILRSTVPVGSTRSVFIPIVERISGLKAGKDFSVVFAPERMVEGSALQEIKKIPQIIGGIDRKSVSKAIPIFRPIIPQVLTMTSLEGAELVKLFNNTYRDVTFGLANEMAMICDGFNLNPAEVIDIANENYGRSHIPRPSPGVGGYCLTKDPFILLHSTRKMAYRPNLVSHARRLNNLMPNEVAHNIFDFLHHVARKSPRRAKVSILGFAFKGHPETADIRFSPTKQVVQKLKGIGKIIGHDPVVPAGAIQGMGAIPAKDLAAAFRGSDVVVLMTNHVDYRKSSLLKLIRSMNKPALFFDPWQLHPAYKFEKLKKVYYRNLGFSTYKNKGFNIFINPDDIPHETRMKTKL